MDGAAGESCDDGNTTDGDGCSAACLIEPGYACAGAPSRCALACGDGALHPELGETCDDGDTADGEQARGEIIRENEALTFVIEVVSVTPAGDS